MSTKTPPRTVATGGEPGGTACAERRLDRRESAETSAGDGGVLTLCHTVSHKLKTPLTAAREYVTILLDGLAGPVSDQQREYLEIARASCDRMTSCLEELLDAVHLESGEVDLDAQPTDFAGLVESAVAPFRGLAKQRSLGFAVDLQPGLPAARIDGQRIAQVLTLLLDNAFKFTASGTVSVSVSTLGEDRIGVSVSDTGHGIGEADQARVFERLYQVRDEHGAAHGGLGMGLPVCLKLVSLHGGELRVESELGRGSTFTFTVPACDA